MARLAHEVTLRLRAELDRLDAPAGRQLSVRIARHLLAELGERLDPEEFQAADDLVSHLEQGLAGRELTKPSYGPVRSRFFDLMYAAQPCSGRLLRQIHLAERASFQRETERAGLTVRHRHQPNHRAVVDGLLDVAPDPGATVGWIIGQVAALEAQQR